MSKTCYDYSFYPCIFKYINCLFKFYLRYENPEIRLYGGHNENEGFIQFYNETERRWTLICDDSFNDRTAEVACRNMGKESSNVIVRRTQYYDIFVLGYPKMHEQVRMDLLTYCQNGLIVPKNLCSSLVIRDFNVSYNW